MASIFPTTVPSKRLSASINASSMAFQLNNINGWNGAALTSSDFGTKAYGVFRNPENTLIEIFEFDPSTIASASITILRRGLKFTGDLTTEVSGNKLTWVRNETIVELGSDVPQLLKHYVDDLADQTIAGIKIFSSLPQTTGGNPVSDNDLVRKAYADTLVLGNPYVNRIVVAGNAGATVAIDQLVYLDPADQEWKLCDADTAATVENAELGITQGAGTDGNAISGGVLVFGRHTASSAIFTAGTVFASNTAGGFSSSAGTKEVSLGIAISTTVINFFPRYDQMLTEDQQDALAGSSGTPSAANKYVTEADVSSAAASDKIVRATGTELPALSTSNLLGLNRFGGTGADGALSITSGTTTINLANAAVVVKNYTSISITGTGVLAFSNPNTNGTVVMLLSQGNVTLTSSATPMIDMTLMGGQASGNKGATTVIPYLCSGGAEGADNSGGNGGAGGTRVAGANSNSPALVVTHAAQAGVYSLACGGAGGVGGAGGGTGGPGGAGGGALLIECRGALNFTTASGISVAGANGSAGTSAGQGAGGGGGGAGGTCLIVYNSLTAASGTITVAGGTGGTGATGGSQSPGTGGAGGNGASGDGGGGTGGNGADTSGGTGGGGGGAGGSYLFGTTVGATGSAGGNTGTNNQGPGGGGGGGASGYALVVANKARI